MCRRGDLARLSCEGFNSDNFSVDREGLHRVHVGKVSSQGIHFKSALAACVQARHRIVTFEEVGGFDAITFSLSHRVGECFFDFEGCHDGIFCTRFH